MLIVGAKGFAKEVLEVLHQNNETENLVFYDDVNDDAPEYLYGQFKILKNSKEASTYFKMVDNRFTIGIGNPILRKKLAKKFNDLGGEFTSTISPLATIGSFGNAVGEGCNIMTGVVITNDIVIKTGTLINLNCTVGHDSIINEFVELCPGVHVSGNCFIGGFSVLGTNATVLPNINIGKNVVVGAGSVVTKDVPDNCVVIGIPAKIIKNVAPLEF
ncbi:sugar O-acyltransferase (sialic acid O-acetyltransferase NeuD family) [Flavobacterium sp. CG_9.1]|uniref:acetyltransferase n=1 Tax=Flavobacterium sp. CG_9.1 TaxID=2787728 RepID=UPI0018CA65E1|nr:acetyltransferase [Flavobacterium sp. CG_9.1]MBG6062953.1 sugar O-acyltransferase (sialic acid O-acetyltransferase NeuD family) [Flavobacterium sp. CG_9.1]